MNSQGPGGIASAALTGSRGRAVGQFRALSLAVANLASHTPLLAAYLATSGATTATAHAGSPGPCAEAGRERKKHYKDMGWDDKTGPGKAKAGLIGPEGVDPALILLQFPKISRKVSRLERLGRV